MTTAGKGEMKNCNSSNYAYEELLLSIQMKTDKGQVAFHIVANWEHQNRHAKWQCSLVKTQEQVCAKNSPKKTGAAQRIPDEQVEE